MSVDVAKKRQGYLEWSDYFMANALLAAKRSKDPNTQVGACIVNDENKIVGIGYNGFPIGCSDDAFPWNRKATDPLDTKYMYVCHAELNAILNKNSADIKQCILYTTMFPCNECTKVIVQSRLRQVVYLSDTYGDTASAIASKRMLDSAGIEYVKYVPKTEKIVIDLTDPDAATMNKL